MRHIVPLLAACALAAAAHAQVAPSPDAPGRGDKTAMPGANSGQPTDGPVSPDAGIPSDVHADAPPVTTQAPPATAGDSAPTDAKSKGRAKPASTAKKPPRG